jgi:transcription elongation factor GreA
MSNQHAITGRSPRSPRDEVVPGATVVVRDLDTDTEEEFTLVGIRDVDNEAGKILVDSPLARGLLRKHVGDKVAIKVPAGSLNLEIVSIRIVEK